MLAGGHGAHGAIPLMGGGLGRGVVFGVGPLYSSQPQLGVVYPCDAGLVVGLVVLLGASHRRCGVGHDGVVVGFGPDSLFVVAHQARIHLVGDSNPGLGFCDGFGFFGLAHGGGRRA